MNATKARLERIPVHIGIIPDGNRRYARKHGLSLEQSYEIGVEKVKEVLRWSREFGVKYVTIYALSQENLQNRSKNELNIIFKLMKRYLGNISSDREIHENKVRILIAGETRTLPRDLQEAIVNAQSETQGYNNYYLILLIAYGGRQEIINAINKILSDNRYDKVTEEIFKRYLYLPNIPYPDLVIRTSGEMRISNFLLWQIAYSELYFSKLLWPEFSKEEFIKALTDYQKRERRYGK